MDGDAVDAEAGASGHEQMVKKLVRLALASEYSRAPVRRADITAKGAPQLLCTLRLSGVLIKITIVMAPNTGRQFKQIFEEAQQRLRDVFGMELTELPQREKVTVAQKRG